MKGPADLVFTEGCCLLVSCFVFSPSRPFPTHWCRASHLHLFREPILSLTTDFAGDMRILTTTVLFGKELFAVAKTSVLTRGHLWREDQRTASRDSGRTPGGAWGGATCTLPPAARNQYRDAQSNGSQPVRCDPDGVAYGIFTL